MGQLIQPRIIKEIITQGSDAQVKVVIDLNINLSGGNVSISSKQEQIEEEKPAWEIPDFKSGEKIKFGKKES